MPDVVTTLRVPNYASAPSSPTKGQLYINTTDNLLYFYNGTSWTALSSGAVSISGTPTAGQDAQWTSASAIKGVSYASTQGTRTVNTAGTASTTGVQTGVGAYITPTATGKVHVAFSGGVQQSGASGQSSLSVSYGTGTLPVHGAALAGTVLLPSTFGNTAAANQILPFAMSVLATGLPVGTQHWFDIRASNNATSGTVTLWLVAMTAIEIP